MKIRKAEELDRTFLIELLSENKMGLAGPPNDYLVAVDGKNICGCLRLEEHENFIMIRPLVVHRNYRRKGIGRLLIETESIKKKPMAAVARGEAVVFYESLGFSITSWESFPAAHQAECRNCPEKIICRPQPMVQDSV